MRRILLLLISVLLSLGFCCSCDKENKLPLPNNYYAPFIVPTYDEYVAYLENYSPLPAWFVSYDDISFLGEYVSFEEIAKEGEEPPSCANVIYTLQDTHGSFNLQSVHWYLYKEDFVPYEGVKYEKENERISAITWVYKGTEFAFFDLENYPENAEGTFVSRLLDPDTVDAAVAEFNLRVKGY